MRTSVWIRVSRACFSGIFALGLISAVGAASPVQAGSQVAATPQVVPYVDLSRYTGLWYEIASNPTLFERGCVGTTATYSARADGLIDVLNKCYVRTFAGRERIAQGLAAVIDPITNARLSVSFSGGAPTTTGQGNYWILELGTNYEYAAVGDPTGSYLWILSRTPTLDDATLQGILGRLEAQGYDTSSLKLTQQKP